MVSGRHWTELEDAKLSDYISRNGSGNWKAVAAHIGTRTANSCRQRWVEFHCSGVRRGEFTLEEKLTTLLLLSKYKQNSFSKISKDLPGRTSNQVKNYCNKMKNNATDFPVGIIKRLVEEMEGEGKSIKSCLDHSAYKELVRLTPPATVPSIVDPQEDFNYLMPPQNESSLVPDVDYPDGFFDLLPPEPNVDPIGSPAMNLDHLDLFQELGNQEFVFPSWKSP